MKIKIIGKENNNRWSLEINDKLITLNGCDYLIILSLAAIWINNKDNTLNKSMLFDDNTSRYIYRMKQSIRDLTGFDVKNMIKNVYLSHRKKEGKYRLNVDEVIIEDQAYLFDDYRFKKIMEAEMHSTGSGTKDDPIIESDYIHNFFGLSYANYLVLHRSTLQSMDADWQKKFVELLEKLDEMYSNHPDMPCDYMVKAKDNDGKFIIDPFADYERGRRFIEPVKI